MAAKKSSKGKKVGISCDPEALSRLLDAIDALRDAAGAFIANCDHPPTKKKLTKRAKRR